MLFSKYIENLIVSMVTLKNLVARIKNNVIQTWEALHGSFYYCKERENINIESANVC